MNLHVVQTPEAYAELELMRANLHVVSPQNHAPLLVGIQNAPLGLWMMTRQGCTFGAARAAAIARAFQKAPSQDAARAEPPALLRPARRWTGKQLVSMALPSSLFARKRARSAIANQGSGVVADLFPSAARVWGGAGDPGPRAREVDDVVVVHRGHLVSGRLDKKVMYGPVGVMHGIIARGTPQQMAACLSEVSRVAQVFMTHFLQHTIGLRDVMPSPDVERRVAAYGAAFLGTLRRAEAVAAAGRVSEWRAKLETERLVGEYLGRVVTLTSTLADPEAPLARSIRSGCKGSAVNRAQFCSMGQQTSFGVRPSLADPGVAMLPSFAPGDTSARPLGLVLGGISTGLRPEELWAACKAGRAALINTAVGTRKSGGLQRIVARGEQGVMVAYDGAVCTPAGHLLDLSYGHDNADATRLLTVPVPWVNATAAALFGPLRWRHPGPDPAGALLEFLAAARATLSSAAGEPPIELAALPFLPSALLAEHGGHALDPAGAAERWARAAAALHDLIASLRSLHPGAPPVAPRPPDGPAPGIPLYAPHMVLEGTLLAELHPARLEAAGVDPAVLEAGGPLRRHIEDVFVASRVAPGSPVGYVAAYAKGHRQTQQTLNDFHFAGVQQAVGSIVARAEELLCATSTKIPISRWALSRAVAAAGPDAARSLAATLPCTTLRDVVAGSWVVPAGDLARPAGAGRPGLGPAAAALLQAHRETIIVGPGDEPMELCESALLLELDVGECRERSLALSAVAGRARGFVRDPRAVVLSSARAEGGAARWFLAVVPVVKAGGGARQCMDALAHAMLHELVVSGVRGVTHAASGDREVFERDAGEGRLVARQHPFIEMRGKGLDAARDMHGVLTDFRRCTTNCVHEAQAVLGVAAARVVYMRELTAVLSSSGFISPRHLMISAGVQFCRGTYAGIADQGRGINSIIMRAIQAKPVAVFSAGAFVGEVDPLHGPSAAVVGGRMAQGTGAAEVVPDLDGAPPGVGVAGLDHVSFRLFSPRSIVRRSVVRVTSKDTFAPDGSPVPGGLMDTRFGSQPNMKCGTCLRDEGCIPHMGHYELARPIFPFFLKQSVVHALRCICPACGRLKVFTAGARAHAGLAAVLREPPRRRLRAFSALCDRVTRCPHADCGMPQPHYRPARAVVERTWPPRTVWEDEVDRDTLTAPLTPQEAFDLFDGIPRALSASLMGLHPSNRLSDLMITVLPIPSAKTRPFARGAPGRRRCDDMTLALQRIILEDQHLRRAIEEAGHPLWREPCAGVAPAPAPRRAVAGVEADAAERLSKLIASIETMTAELAKGAEQDAAKAPAKKAPAHARPGAHNVCVRCEGRRQRINEAVQRKGMCRACSHGFCQGAGCAKALSDPSWTFACELCGRNVGGSCATRCCKVTWPDTQTCVCRKCATVDVLHGLMREARATCAGPCGRPMDEATGSDARKWLMRATARGKPWRVGVDRTTCLVCSSKSRDRKGARQPAQGERP